MAEVKHVGGFLLVFGGLVLIIRCLGYAFVCFLLLIIILTIGLVVVAGGLSLYRNSENKFVKASIYGNWKS